MTLDLDALEKIAKAATPGPWTCEKPRVEQTSGFPAGVAIAATYGRQMIYASPPGGSFPAADQRHIATFDPPTVRALIEAARERDHLRNEVDQTDGVLLRAQLAELENATLRAQIAQAREALERAKMYVDVGLHCVAHNRGQDALQQIAGNGANVLAVIEDTLAAITPDPASTEEVT